MWLKLLQCSYITDRHINSSHSCCPCWGTVDSFSVLLSCWVILVRCQLERVLAVGSSGGGSSCSSRQLRTGRQSSFSCGSVSWHWYNVACDSFHCRSNFVIFLTLVIVLFGLLFIFYTFFWHLSVFSLINPLKTNFNCVSFFSLEQLSFLLWYPF